MIRFRCALRPLLMLVMVAVNAAPLLAQLAPEIGYVYPPGGQRGTTVEVILGGYDWTPDMQLFVHDPRITLEIIGPPGPVLVPEPPYWFGAKARENDLPLPREVPARLTIPADVPPGPVQWQVANASGASLAGTFWIGADRDVRETRRGQQPQLLEALPVAVSGQIRKIEEIDRYRFTATQSGPVTCELFTRRLQSKMNGVLQVTDGMGRMIADAADTVGSDLAVTFPATAGMEYTVALFDGDFRGDRSFVYRLAIGPGPRVVAMVPAAVTRGSQQTVELMGYGLASETGRVEAVQREVSVPADPSISIMEYELVTPTGNVLVPLPISDLVELVEPAESRLSQLPLAIPCGLTGAFDGKISSKRFSFKATAGESLCIRAEGGLFGAKTDLAILIQDATGKPLASSDDYFSSSDAELDFTMPADGIYEVDVTNQSPSPTPWPPVYRLSIDRAKPDLQCSLPPRLDLLIGGSATMEIKATSKGAPAAPTQFSFENLPPGVTVAGDLILPAGSGKLDVTLNAAKQCAALGTMVSVVAKTEINGQSITRTSSLLLATVLKPPFKITPEGLDDVRKAPRGTTFPAPLLIERSPDFHGEIVLEQTSQQQRTRQGITGPDLTVPDGVQRVEYPVFLPEWLETTKTSRMILNGVAKIPDPQGNIRYVLGKMELRIGMLPQGAMLKLSHEDLELNVRAGDPFQLPIQISRVPELTEPLQLELIVPDELNGLMEADLPTLSNSDASAIVQFKTVAAAELVGEHEITLRATALQHGVLPVVSETTITVDFGRAGN